MPGVRAEFFIFQFLKVLNNMAESLVAPALSHRLAAPKRSDGGSEDGSKAPADLSNIASATVEVGRNVTFPGSTLSQLLF